MKNEETYENSKVRIINPLSAEYLLENSKIIVLDHQYIRDAIKTDYMYKWTPATPVFISAQTGSGKNTFIEEIVIKKMVKLNYKILILSNRIALGRQEKKRIAEIMDSIVPKQDRYSSYAEEVEERRNSPRLLDKLEDFGAVTIKSYQGLGTRKDNMAEHYDFIIFDECHFFLADAKFNKYTYRILDDILKRYPHSIRVYMTATPSEAIIPIIKAECVIVGKKYLDIMQVTPIVMKNKNPSQYYWNNSISNEFADYKKYTLINNCDDSKGCEPLKTEMQNVQCNIPIFLADADEKEKHDTYETYNHYQAVIYEVDRDYRYIECKYLNFNKNESSSEYEGIDIEEKLPKQYQALLKLIMEQIGDDERESKGKEKIEKWLIFVPNKEWGQQLLKAIGSEYADYIDSRSKNSKKDDGIVYEGIVTNKKFNKKVLITTSVLDNGINIIDSHVKHIAILIFDKVSFLQMLGRKRMNQNEKITLYLQEYNSRSLNYKLQMTIKDLARMQEARSNHEKVIGEVFDNDEVFFYTGGISNSHISYNKFLEDKLKYDKMFLSKFVPRRLSEEQSFDDFGTKEINEITYEQYIQKLKYEEDTIDEIAETAEDECNVGKKTIIEQLSWIGKEGRFDPNNYLDQISDADKEKNEENKNKFLEFLQSTVEEEKIPDKGPNRTNFYREKGMDEIKQDDFCKKFTELCIKAYGYRPEDKKDEDIMYGKDIISKRLKDKQLPYIVMDCSVKTLVTEKGQDSRPSRTLWILKKIEL